MFIKVNIKKCLWIHVQTTKSITYPTKILILTITPFLFISWRLLWMCYGARCVQFTVRQEEEVHSSYWGHRCAHSAVHSLKKLKPLFTITLLCQGYWWIEKKNTNNCVMVLIIRPGSTLNFHFVFGFNECLWAIFPLLNFENFSIYIWVMVVWLLSLGCRWLYFKSPLTRPPMPMNKKLDCKDQ